MKFKKKKIKTIDITPIFLLTFFLIISIAMAQQLNSTSYKIQRVAIDSGGNFTSNDYFLELTTESIGGNSSSTNHAVCIGYNCCPGNVHARYLNSTVNESASTATVNFALWQADVCMGTGNVTVDCTVNCDPCTQSCSVSTTRHTLILTDILFDNNTISISDPNVSTPIYCRVRGDIFQFETCFNSPTNLTVTVEAGGPYVGTSATVLIAGNTTYSDGTAVSGVNVTVDVFKQSNLANRIATSNVISSKDGKYFATFGNFEIDAYRVNVTARFESVRANATDTFSVISVHSNCQIKTITLSGRALDATTGETIPSGTASLTIEETTDKKDTAITDGIWSTDMVTCLISGAAYTVTVKITDTQGKVSWSEIKFVAP